MKKILILLSLLFIFSCSNEYWSFHEKKQEIKTINYNLDEELKRFSFENIEYLSWITITQTPDTKYLDEIVKKIENAKTRVYLEVYIFTEKRLQSALKKAHKNWVDVKVLLEKNVYKSPNLNKKSYDNLSRSGIAVKYSNPDNYALNHTKMLIIDNEVILSTWNYSYSSFKYNKEFFLNIFNEEILTYFEQIFINDFEWKKFNIYHHNLVLSPFYTREKLEYLIKNSKKSIKMYVNNIWDKNIINYLVNAKKQWLNVEIILPSLQKVSSNKKTLEIFDNNNISYKLNEWKIQNHSKAILIDDKILYVWSINFSTASIDENREVWIILKNEEIISDFLRYFNKDFK